MTLRDRDREIIRRVLTHRDRDREGKIGQPDCNFPPSAGSRVRRDGYAGADGVVQDCICIAFNAQSKVYEIEILQHQLR